MSTAEEQALVDPWSGDERLPEYFGESWPTMLRFEELLRVQGGPRGLLGPRESMRLWERHLLNCAAVGPLLASAAEVIDLGSGAGLPGVVLAAMLPGSRIVLLEAMQRRADWLTEVSAELGLANVEVVRARAEDVAGRFRVDAVTARAVGPLAKLAGWAGPLLSDRGLLVALKGRQARREVEESGAALRRAGFGSVEVLSLVSIAGAEETTVVLARRGRDGD